jgi:hypothetical protein
METYDYQYRNNTRILRVTTEQRSSGVAYVVFYLDNDGTEIVNHDETFYSLIELLTEINRLERGN